MRIIGVSGTLATLKYVAFSLAFFCICLVVALYFGNGNQLPDVIITDHSKEAVINPQDTGPDPSTETEEETKNEKAPSAGGIMIDPGHGGEDGGAVAPSGILEKDLNLLVSDNIAHMCLLFGIPYNMTREDDSMLYDKYSELDDYTGRKKSLDLKNRLKFTKDSNSSLLVSVHMNKFSSENVRGLQVYYSKNTDDGAALADAVHSYVAKHIQRNNNRVAKAADSSIYLLNKAEIPSILVEFGFLSNPIEADLLSDPLYRASISTVVFVPILEYAVRK